MPAIRSLGVHTSAGLQHLVDEGLLPPDPRPDLYHWETFIVDGEDGEIEEELLATKHAVVWSHGGFVRQVYRFEVEGEEVRQAVLTNFPAGRRRLPKVHEHSMTSGSTFNVQNAGQDAGNNRQNQGTELRRALVIFLKTQAHFYFLDGQHHIAHLPFEIERAFPGPRGLILQRKPPTAAIPVPLTPRQPPAAPQNSFWSSQLQPNSSYTQQTPTLRTSQQSSQPSRPNLLGPRNLHALFKEHHTGVASGVDDDAARLYSLTDPLEDFGVLTYALQTLPPRLSGRGKPSSSVKFESLDQEEEVIYVSSSDELGRSEDATGGFLMLIVTANRDLKTLTVWHAWYIGEKSLVSLLKQRMEAKEGKSRRRSSFISQLGAGANTPAVRHRDGTRESFAAGAFEPGVSQTANSTSKRTKTRQEEEEAMASQIDPDYQASSQPHAGARESRRISSLVSRNDLSQSGPVDSQGTINASFVGVSKRRGPSFGGTTNRKSFGHRKSRGSTPGSRPSQTSGPDEDGMELDGSSDEDSVEGVLRHIRATHEAASADTVFGSADDGYRRELVLRKVHSIPLSSGLACSAPSTGQRWAEPTYKVAVLAEAYVRDRRVGRRLDIHIQNRQSKKLQCLQLRTYDRSLFSEERNAPRVTIPIFEGHGKDFHCSDVSLLRDGPLRAVLLGDKGLLLSPDSSPIPLPKAVPYRMFDPLDTLSDFKTSHRDVGRQRILPGPGNDVLLAHAGTEGKYDEVTHDGVVHRRRILLRPIDGFINQALDVCDFILPVKEELTARRLWCICHSHLVSSPNRVNSTASGIEWIAFTTAVFCFAIGSIDRSALRRPSLSKAAFPDKQAAISRQRQSLESTISSSSAWTWLAGQNSNAPTLSPPDRKLQPGRDELVPLAASLAAELLPSLVAYGFDWLSASDASDIRADCCLKVMQALHLLREEQKLDTLAFTPAPLAPIIAQLGRWLGLRAWSSYVGDYYELEGGSEEQWAFVRGNMSKNPVSTSLPFTESPPSVLQWFEQCMKQRTNVPLPTLEEISRGGLTGSGGDLVLGDRSARLTPRSTALRLLLYSTGSLTLPPVAVVEAMNIYHLTAEVMETLPEAIVASLRDVIAACEKDPPTTWPAELLQLVGRGDLDTRIRRNTSELSTEPAHTTQDVQTVCHSVDAPVYPSKTRGAARHAVSSLVFSEDRRLVEATSMMHFSSIQLTECPAQSDWSEAYHYEQQRRIMHWVTVRMIALPAGDGMLHFDSQVPLMTEKFQLPGFSNACIMKPMNNTITTDRTGLTEEKVNWAYFHAGVSAGLRISRKVTGIDTTWIVFNKPPELTNRHAGLLLALGINGHLRNLARAVSLKYLTPKHTMTSVGLLLGLAASYMGTMDSRVTRMLSVHITRLLPDGAADLNVSPVIQTAGLMSIGLLYANSQHRRMSEVMLSEIEYAEVEDPDTGPDLLRSESYRLAAGFALGFMNLAKGESLQGLHGLRLLERLLAVAIGPRPAGAVHVFDQATAGAVMAITLIHMKTNSRAVAAKVNVPDTAAQFDHVRPDMLMLRTIAKYLILWDSIQARGTNDKYWKPDWITSQFPSWWPGNLKDFVLIDAAINSTHIPYFYIMAGLAFALGLKYAGTGDKRASKEILAVLGYFSTAKGGNGADRYFYDAKLAHAAIRRCIDATAVAASIVMAGTGDLQTFRHLRRLHGNTDAETPYGSHLASHLAIGILFLGGGTYTFGTSNMAVASLLLSLYPLFPTDVQDNRCHLQAFRHIWVLAAEARCIVFRDVDTHRPVHMPIQVAMHDGTMRHMRAPCLLPELHTISALRTADPGYWRVTLDLAGNSGHLERIKASQILYVRRCPASEAHSSAFSATLAALNDAQSQNTAQQVWHWIFKLHLFRDMDPADIELILPPDETALVLLDGKGTVVDDRLVLLQSIKSVSRDALWNLRMLFAWAERTRDDGDGRLRCLGREVVESLKARIQERMRAAESFS